MKNYCYCVVALCCCVLFYHAPAMGQQSVCAENTLGNVLVMGEEVRVPILIQEPNTLAAFGMTLNYDNTKVTYARTEKSVITMDWLALDGSENVAGEITIGGFHITPIATTTPDTLCFIVFDEIINEPDEAAACFFMQTTNFSDGLAGTQDCITSGCVTPAENATWGRIKALWD